MHDAASTGTVVRAREAPLYPELESDPPPLAAPSRSLAFPTDPEPMWKRRVFEVLALAVVVGFFFVLHSYWAPAPGRPGIDENGYMVGGKMMADHLSTSMRAPEPYSYVGMMWVRTPAGIYYPKYPAGVPLIYATLIRASPAHGKIWCFYVSPVCAALAVMAMFLLTRLLAGSFYGLMGAIVLATGQTTLQFADIPSSHAPALACTLWGMCLLAFWCRDGRAWVGALAGFMLGYAITIRYTEGLLLLPLMAAVGMNLGFALRGASTRHLKAIVTSLVPVFTWLIPPLALVIFNKVTLGSWTGYDLTKESTGFTPEEFFRKWEFTTQQVYLYGLFFVAPVGIVGMVTLFHGSWRWGLLMTLWFIPGAILYTAYYWGLRTQGVGFLRFFLTLFPPVIACAMWLLGSAGRAMADEASAPSTRGSVANPIATGLVTAIAVAAGLYASLYEMERQHAGNLNLSYSAAQFLRNVPNRPGEKPVVFADTGIFPQLLMHLQFMGDCDWYSGDAFEARFDGGFFLLGHRKKESDQNSPVLVQPERAAYISGVFKGKSTSDLVREQNRIMNDAFDHSQAVYALMTPAMVWDFEYRFLGKTYEAKEIDRWRELADVPLQREDTPLTSQSHLPNLVIDWRPQSWKLLKITRKAPATTQTAAK